MYTVHKQIENHINKMHTDLKVFIKEWKFYRKLILIANKRAGLCIASIQARLCTDVAQQMNLLKSTNTSKNCSVYM